MEEVAKTWEEPAGWNKSLRFHVPIGGKTIPEPSLRIHLWGWFTNGQRLHRDDTLGLAVLISVPVWFERKSWLVSRNLRERISTWAPTSLSYGKASEKGQRFLPTDVALSPDGTLFFSDFYNDTSRRTNQVSGSIYRVTRKETYT